MPDAQADLFDFRYSLPNLTESLKKQRKIRIVAIGSSSTAGEADVLPYPPRLEILLRDHFHDRMIDVLNRGIGGQEAPCEFVALRDRRCCGGACAGDLAGRHQRRLSQRRIQV